MANIKRGDSIERDVKSPNVTDFTGWTGTWGLFSKVGGTALKTGSLTVSSDKKYMACRVPPYTLSTAPPLGIYYLEIEVFSSVLNIRKTIQEEIVFTATGLLV